MKFQNCDECLSNVLRDQNCGTHNPSLALAIGELLSISPLEEEVVCRGKLRRQAPFAEPERTVSKGSIICDAVQVADALEVSVGVSIGDTLKWSETPFIEESVDRLTPKL